MLSGTAYGVVLNDRHELAELGRALAEPPYLAPPEAPVLYIKPKGCVVPSGAKVVLDASERATAAATIGLLFARDIRRATKATALESVGALCLALDVAQGHTSYYRPAIRERCRDGFLPLGAFAAFDPAAASADIVTLVDGEEAHRWSMSRVVRTMEALIADMTDFMTLAAGDMLLVGLPGDPPSIAPGQRVEARSGSLPPVRAHFVSRTAE